MKHLCDTDVLVVGGGPAGIGAGVAAARTGAKTLLVERRGPHAVDETLEGTRLRKKRKSTVPKGLHE